MTNFFGKFGRTPEGTLPLQLYFGNFGGGGGGFLCLYHPLTKNRTGLLWKWGPVYFDYKLTE